MCAGSIHRPKGKASHDDGRPSAAGRGYGAAWRKLRRMVLNRDPLCVKCKANGKLVYASEADHIIPKSRGGRDSLVNLQGLCKRCHSKKTRKENAKPQ